MKTTINIFNSIATFINNVDVINFTIKNGKNNAWGRDCPGVFDKIM